MRSSALRRAPKPPPDPAGCSWARGARGAASPYREPQRGGGRAGRPARKENVLPAEAAVSRAHFLGSTSAAGRLAGGCLTGQGRRALTSLCDSSWNGHSLGCRELWLFPPFRHDPVQKCQMQLPGRTGIFGTLTSCPPR